jgi:DNA polymerase III subunit chi
LAEIRFYHLRTATLERALPRLLEKVLALGERAVVVAGAERLAALDAALWTYDDRAFLPHASSSEAPPPGIAREDYARHQPVWLTEQIESPNGAGVLVLSGDGDATPDLANWRMAIHFIDGADDQAVDGARARWREYKAAGHDLTYWTQGQDGGWTKTA